MRITTAVFGVSESGEVVHEVYMDDSYRKHVAISHYGSPYLGSYEDADHFRGALAAYAMNTATENYALKGIHGWRLAFVDEACAVYVFTIDSDA